LKEPLISREDALLNHFFSFLRFVTVAFTVARADYIQQIEAIIGAEQVYSFDSITSMLSGIDAIKNALPYRLGAP